MRADEAGVYKCVSRVAGAQSAPAFGPERRTAIAPRDATRVCQVVIEPRIIIIILFVVILLNKLLSQKCFGDRVLPSSVSGECGDGDVPVAFRR